MRNDTRLMERTTMNKPLVSVIIPNYNNGKYIEQCIESIEKQTYSPIEIVIVDDSSTDNSRDIIDALARKYSNIVRVYLDKNGGVSNARNKGAEASQGDYLCFLDADDFFWSEDKIQNEMGLILRHLEKEEKVLAYSGVVCVNEDGVKVDDRGLDGQLEGNIAPAYVARYKVDKHLRNALYDREAFFEAGYYDVDMSFWEDFDQIIKILMLRPAYFTGAYGTSYRWKVGGLSRTSALSGKTVLKQIEKKHRKKLKGSDYILYLKCKGKRFFYEAKRKNIPALLHKGSVIKHIIFK